jgi:lipoate-protein ligase A
MKWRLLKHLDSTDPYQNLAVEEALSNCCARWTTVRLWVNSDSVIVGRFQSVLEEVDLDYCLDNEIAVVRRHTGGGAVFQDLGNLNVTLVAPRCGSLDVLESYRTLARCMVATLRGLGVAAEYLPPNRVLAGSKKVSGMAAAVTKTSLICHSTLLVSSDLGKMVRALRKVKHGVTTVARELGRKVPLHEVCEVLVRTFEGTYGVKLEEGELTDEETRLSEKLLHAKYSRDWWNFGTRVG